MRGVIGVPCMGCGGLPGNCTCERVEFVKRSPWTRAAQPPHHCEKCFVEWKAATFPMTKKET